MRPILSVVLLLALVSLVGCAAPGDPKAAIDSQLVPAPSPGATRDLVVVLPGRGDDVADLRASGIAESIQASLPDADVLLAGVTMAHYFGGRMPQRLHDEVIVPARARGYAHVWLAGASMGGMGTVLYENAYPREMDGLVLFAPFLGEREQIAQVVAAGGLAQWDPGPVPAAIDKDNYQREVWRTLKRWSAPGDTRAQRVWLAYGRNDKLREAAQPLVAILPPGHVFEREGGHAWVVWTPAAREVFAEVAKAR
jgi:pimeloyl-ACP methyl ester carboxylesterase